VRARIFPVIAFCYWQFSLSKRMLHVQAETDTGPHGRLDGGRRSAPVTIERAGSQGESAEEPCMLLQTSDGGAFLVPMSALEQYRLSDEQRGELAARLGANGDDVQGYTHWTLDNNTQTGPVGQFPMSHPGWNITCWGANCFPGSPWPFNQPGTGDGGDPNYHPPLR
jgi:hypothetical protein